MHGASCRAYPLPANRHGGDALGYSDCLRHRAVCCGSRPRHRYPSCNIVLRGNASVINDPTISNGSRKQGRRMKVSILLVTYNHQRYIAQAIESVLMQQTDFEYEILISEDCSTDSTRDIVIGYQARHPDKIRLLLSEDNLNDNSVVLRGIRAARGEYVAYLDGDDYWMSPQKLQKQVQFLDGHLECSMCFHECAILSGDTSDARTTRSSIKLFSLNDLLEDNLATACSVMFRLAALGNVPDWYTGCVFGDWPLYILLSQQGMVAYLPDCLAVYRIHSGGQWSGLPEGRRIEQLTSFYARLRSHLGPRYDRLLRRITSSHYLYVRAQEPPERREGCGRDTCQAGPGRESA
jgi:glycosyltransferase involved in cell wall biosynthesis